ncbi:MAG TPA: hypothetical protein VL485_11440 [Ktedonobacteraceae bacterium]|nr:hypothetical protein [Ktedonobacteraceae bacterium]
MSKIENELSPRTAAQSQPPLPAWLETLRAGERPASPANVPTGNSFSAADLLDEGTLPSWMRSGRNESEGNAPATAADAFSPDPFSQNAPQISLRQSSQPGPNTGDDILPPRGLAANSLIDEKALPSWMQENKTSQTEPPSSISAASLLQPDALPEWMRNMQPQQTPPSAQGSGPFARQTPPPAQGSGPFSQQTPASPRAAVPPSKPEVSPAALAPQGFSAGALVDPQSLPSWMSQQGNQQNAPGTPSNGVQPGQTGFSAGALVDPQSLPSWMSQQGNQQNAPSTTPSSGVQPGQTGFSAGALVDPQSLPSWMSQQGNQQNAPSTPSNSVQPGQAGFSAASLLDADALPSWLQGQGQGGGQSQQRPNPNPPSPAGSAPSRPQPAAQNSWPPAPSPIQTPPAQPFTAGIAASSFIDMNSLPEWMRSEGGAGQQTGMAGAGRPGFSGPPRVENVRVPSRPRTELAAADTSEAAANVFASMLGVASSTPQYPAQPASSPLPPQGGQYTPPQMPQGAQSPMASATGMNSGSYGQPPATPMNSAPLPSPAPSPYGAPGGYQNGVYKGNTPGSYSPGAPQGTGPFNNTPGANAPYGSTAYPGNVPGAGSASPGAAEAQRTAKPAKRSFFDSLRDLFFH